MKSFQRPIFFAALFAALVTGLGIVAPVAADPMTGGNIPFEDVAPPCATSGYVLPPRCPWYFQTDAVALRRDPQGRTTFATLGNSTDVALSTSELDPQFKGGVQFLFGHVFEETPWSVEGSYFWIDAWEPAAVAQHTPGTLLSPFSNFGNPVVLPGFDNNHLVTVNEISQLQNGEVNVKYLLPMPYNGFRASLMLGVRYMSVQEHLFYHSESALPLVASGSTVNLTTRTTNDLVGPQIGGFFEFFSLPRSWVTFEMKGALCGNTAMQQTSGSRTDSLGALVTNFDAGDHEVATAFVGDLQLMFNLQITPHCLARMGYQAVWVEGLALAAENLGPNSGILPNSVPAIATGGESVYHGPHLGLEIMW